MVPGLLECAKFLKMLCRRFTFLPNLWYNTIAATGRHRDTVSGPAGDIIFVQLQIRPKRFKEELLWLEN